MEEGYLTTDEIAQHLNVTVETVRRWVRQGKLCALPLGQTGYHIAEADFAAFVHQHQYLSPGQEPDTTWLPFSESTQCKETEEALVRLFTIVNTSQDAIISQSPQGIITSWNAGAYRLYGYEAAEVLGRSMTLLVPEGRRAEYAQLMGSLRRGEHIDQLDTMHQHKDGRSLPVSLILSPLHNLQGELVGVATIARDSSKCVQAEAALLTNEQRFQATFEQAAVGIAHVATDGRWLAVNQRLCDIVGYSREELLARTFQDITFPDDLKADLIYVSQLLAGERLTYTMEKRYVRRDGSPLWAKITVSLVREASGTPLYFISVVEDISERKRLEGLRDDFLAIASHELKAPLTHIKATLQLAQRRLMRLGQHAETNHEESEQIRSTREMLSQAERQVEKQNRLMNDLLDVSRLQTGKLELQMGVCDLTQLVRDVVEDQRALASDCRIEVRPSACDLLILADAQRVGQVISNYLTNALKYSEASRPAEVRMAVDGRMARVEVIDEGPGLTAEQQKCIWERFYRVPGVQVTSSSSERGFGLGLYICKQLIEQQEGQVGVESTLGKGSTFWFTLPLVQEGKEPVTR